MTENVNALYENEEAFYWEAFSRNIGLLSRKDQKRLQEATVGIVGMGGVGGIHATSFARLGVGGFHIADLDTFDVVNLNRQAGATKEMMGKEKVDVMADMIRSINPFARIEKFPRGVTEETVDAFLEGVDVVADGIDFFEIETRRLVYRKAREKGIYVVTAGPVGFGSAVLTFDPRGMSFDEYFDLRDDLSREEMVLRFGLGIAPALLQRAYFKPSILDLKKQKAPSLVIGTLFAAGFVTTESVKILLGKRVRTAPLSAQFDPFVEKYKKISLPFGNRNWLQRLKINIVLRQLRKKGGVS
jgi:molybdopterin/thiamine biosynthesis adenylyltransferase